MREYIETLYLEGFTSREIALKTGKNEATIRKFISRNLRHLSKLHKEQLEIKRNAENLDKLEQIKFLYLKGFNAKEISIKLDLTHQYTRELIAQNLKDCRYEHRKQRSMNREIIKAIDNMNNSYIPNSSFLSWNRQSYDYNKNGNLVFNEDRGSRPKDVPKTFYQKSGMMNNTEEKINTTSMALNLLK